MRKPESQFAYNHIASALFCPFFSARLFENTLPLKRSDEMFLLAFDWNQEVISVRFLR